VAATGADVLTRRTLAVLATTLVAFPACGGDAIAPEAAVADAATKTLAAGSSRFTFTGTLALPETGGRALPISGEGIFDHADPQGRFTYDLSEAAEEAGLGPGEAWQADVIFTGDRFFLRLPALTEGLEGAKPWIEIDTATESGMTPGELMQLGGASDPAQLLQFMRGTSGNVERVGTESVRGVETTRYRARVELSRVIERVPDDDVREVLRRQLERLERQGRATAWHMEVSLDEDGVARRIRMNDPTEARERMTLTMDLYDFGVEVDAEPPPENEVMTEAELERMLAEGAGE
jgi:hypothetical protein